MKWKNRIIGEGTEKPEQLLANPHNWRIHSHHQQDALLAVFEDVGWVQRIIVNKTTGHLIDGHLRVTLSMRHNIKEVPVLYVELTEEEEKKVLATLDPLGALANTDFEKFDDLIEDISFENVDLNTMLNDIISKSPLFPDVDADKEWAGMPEFDNQDVENAEYLIVNPCIVRFNGAEAKKKFGELIGQKLTEKTRYIYIPPVGRSEMSAEKYICKEEKPSK